VKTAAALLVLVVCFVHPLVAQPPVTSFELARPGYVFEFPRDHGMHPEFATEWWYFTGHLRGASGAHYGFELTFFRVGVERSDDPPATAWDLRHLGLAHFAITDVTRRTFRYYEKLNRFSPYTAGARSGFLGVWNEGWSATMTRDGRIRLRAGEGGDSIDLLLRPLKAPVVNGENGVSVKAEGEGYASHYYSLTRLEATGTLTAGRGSEEVTGLAWMDHEFGSPVLRETQAGWDWFALQFENGTELMLYQIRRRDGSPDLTSSGSFVNRNGEVIHLRSGDFRVTSVSRWRSKRSGALYPMGWTIEVPLLQLRIRVDELLRDQELITASSTRVTYWEGAVRAAGTFGGTTVRGAGYVELTGYDKPFEMK
jgi:predicted secreted hydrolase